MSSINIQAAPPGVASKEIKASPLSGSFVVWARHVAEKEHLRVVFGAAPATDGKTMYLPSLPYDLTSDDLLMVRSDIIHESGHCVDTDFDYFVEFGESHGPFAQLLLNSIEDVRIEILRATRYGGAEALIHDSNVLLMKRGQYRTGSADAAEALCTLAYMQGCVLRGWKGEHAAALQNASQYLINHLGDDAIPAIEKATQLLIKRYAGLSSTQDAGQLTLDVLSIFQEAQDDLDENRQADEGDDQSSDENSGNDESGEDGDDPNSGKQSSEGDGSQSEDGSASNDDSPDEGEGSGEGTSGSGKSDEASSNDEEGDGASGAKSSGSEKGGDIEGTSGTGESMLNGNNGDNCQRGQPSSSSVKIAEMLGADPGKEEVIDHHKAVEDLAAQVANGELPQYKDAPLVPAHTADFSGEKAAAGVSASSASVVGANVAACDRFQYQRLAKDTGRAASVVLGRLQMLLRMATQASTEESTRGRLNASKLYRTQFDDNRVFKRTTETILPAAAVTVLTDLSGSMIRKRPDGSSRLDMALQTQVLLSQAMELIGNPTEFAGFGNHSNNVLTYAKTFDQSPMEARERIGGLVHEAGGATPLLEGLMHALMRLGAREERKKLVFIITDGAPSNPEAVGDLMKRAQADGIEMVTFWLAESSHTLPSYLIGLRTVRVSQLDQLPQEFLQVMKQQILGG